jgi:hypothetical protein
MSFVTTFARHAAALREEPAAYASQYEIERHYPADLWKQWMANGGTFLAFDDDQVLVGTATSLRAGDGDTLVVTESNLRVASCYRSYGFVETGRRRAMERDPTIIEIELGYLLGD